MKRLIAVLSGLLVLPAFAEVAPISYDEIVEYSDELIVDDVATDVPKSDAVKQVVVPVASPSRGTSSRSGATNVRNASRVVPAGSATTATRNVATRASASSRNATTARTTTTRASGSVVSRNANASRVSARPSRAVTTSAPAVSSRRATTSNASHTARAGSIIQTDTVNTPLYTGRVGVRSNAIQARMPVASGAAALTSTATTSVDTDISDLDELAQITDYCKAQYTSCMDNFCNVLDDAQGRCSCSANLKNYEKTQNALKQANEDLQDVAQQIQYIGLSSEEIETIFSETEAELAMKGKDDNSDNAVDLSRVKDMVIDVRKKTAYSTTSSGTSFDLSGLLSFDFATDFGFDSLFGSTSDTSSISNQRGDQLYKTATARCKATVLNTCQAQGVDISVITNAYDLEIDKQCIAYERSLTDANDQLVKTVRNAQTVLQRARLMVAQKKNEYDGLRECITALDACMQDDYVCGSDYENCLDPTGKYIVNGKVIEGSTPGAEDSTDGVYATWNYVAKDDISAGNAWVGDGSLKNYISASITDDQDVLTSPSDNMLVYLQSKIGYYDKDSNKNYGMCIGELNKCQKYSYGPDGEYDIDNQVVREYMQRTLVQIKAAQDELLAKYAENCVRDVATCVSRNNTSSVSVTNVSVNACSSVIKTCMSVNGEETSNLETDDMLKWVVDAIDADDSASLTLSDMTSCVNSGGSFSVVSGVNTCTCDSSKNLSLSSDKKSCVSTNPGQSGVDEQEKCIKQGYYWFADGDTCITSLSEYNCRSTGGGWVGGQCSCRAGYETKADGKCILSCRKITLSGGTGGTQYVYVKSGDINIFSDSNCSVSIIGETKYDNNFPVVCVNINIPQKDNARYIGTWDENDGVWCFDATRANNVCTYRVWNTMDSYYENCIYDADSTWVNQFVCDDGYTEDVNGNCVTCEAAGKVLYDNSCVLSEHKACVKSGGSWTGHNCICPGGMSVSNDGSCDEVSMCEKHGDANISVNGNFCAVYGIESETECKSISDKSKAKSYFYMPKDNAHESSVTGVLFDPSMGLCMYLLPSAYNKYYEQCSEYGGQLSLSSKDYKCINITVESEEDCTKIGGSFGKKVNGQPDLTTCKVSLMGILDGELYTAKDLRAISCLPGMDVKNQITGNCACKDGWDYVASLACVPADLVSQYDEKFDVYFANTYGMCWYTGGNWRFDTDTCQCVGEKPTWSSTEGCVAN